MFIKTNTGAGSWLWSSGYNHNGVYLGLSCWEVVVVIVLLSTVVCLWPCCMCVAHMFILTSRLHWLIDKKSGSCSSCVVHTHTAIARPLLAAYIMYGYLTCICAQQRRSRPGVSGANHGFTSPWGHACCKGDGWTQVPPVCGAAASHLAGRIFYFHATLRTQPANSQHRLPGLSIHWFLVGMNLGLMLRPCIHDCGEDNGVWQDSKLAARYL